MKKKKEEKDTRKLRIILDILIILIGFVFLYFGIRDAKVYISNIKKSDAEVFHKEYSYVSVKECVYEYISLKDANKLLKENSVILIGNSEDPYTQVLVKPLNDIYKNKKIYYLKSSVLDSNKKEFDSFKKVLGVKEFNTPTIIITKGNKHVILLKEDIYDSEFDGAPIEYFNNENKEKLKELVTN